jgi:hypothetical protein
MQMVIGHNFEKNHKMYLFQKAVQGKVEIINWRVNIGGMVPYVATFLAGGLVGIGIVLGYQNGGIGALFSLPSNITN